MTKRFVAVLLLLVIVAPVQWGLAAKPARACTCVPTTVADEVGRADLIVTGNVTETNDDGDVVFQVGRYLKGDGPTEIVVANPDNDGTYDCAWLERVSLGATLLLLRSEGNKLSKTGGWPCAGIDGIHTTEAFAAAITEYLGGSPPPDDNRQEAQETESKDLPWLPIASLAVAVPVAFLAIAAFTGKKSGGGH